jgi:hypothetical protein
MVRGGEDVDCERADAIEARVVAGGVGKWHGVAGREDSVADGGGDGNDRDGRERRGADEQDDGRGGDDNDDDADNDDDDDDDDGHNSALQLLLTYIYECECDWKNWTNTICYQIRIRHRLDNNICKYDK